MDPVAISNLALGQVGGKLIKSLGDPSVEAQLCDANFEAVRDAVLEERAWTFATGRLALPPDALTADELAALAPWVARFTLPTTVVRVLSVDDGSGDGTLEWTREGGAIVAEDVAKVYVRAVLRVEDTAAWSPGFTSAVATRLAAVLAIPLAANRQLQADLWGLYARLVKEGGTLDGMQGRAEQVRPGTLAARRR